MRSRRNKLGLRRAASAALSMLFRVMGPQRKPGRRSGALLRGAIVVLWVVAVLVIEVASLKTGATVVQYGPIAPCRLDKRGQAERGNDVNRPSYAGVAVPEYAVERPSGVHINLH